MQSKEQCYFLKVGLLFCSFNIGFLLGLRSDKSRLVLFPTHHAFRLFLNLSQQASRIVLAIFFDTSWILKAKYFRLNLYSNTTLSQLKLLFIYNATF